MCQLEESVSTRLYTDPSWESYLLGAVKRFQLHQFAAFNKETASIETIGEVKLVKHVNEGVTVKLMEICLWKFDNRKQTTIPKIPIVARGDL